MVNITKNDEDKKKDKRIIFVSFSKKIILWFFFSVIVASIPFFFKISYRYFTNAESIIDSSLIIHGELYLVSITIISSGLYESITLPLKKPVLKEFASFFKFLGLIIILASVYFFSLTNLSNCDINKICEVSSKVFLASIFISLCLTSLSIWGEIYVDSDR